MIKLLTDCEKCVHKSVCRHKDNAKNDMEKLAAMNYGNGPNDDYDWNTMSDARHVKIAFSCESFQEIQGVNWR